MFVVPGKPTPGGARVGQVVGPGTTAQPYPWRPNVVYCVLNEHTTKYCTRKIIFQTMLKKHEKCGKYTKILQNSQICENRFQDPENSSICGKRSSGKMAWIPQITRFAKTHSAIWEMYIDVDKPPTFGKYIKTQQNRNICENNYHNPEKVKMCGKPVRISETLSKRPIGEINRKYIQNDGNVPKIRVFGT